MKKSKGFGKPSRRVTASEAAQELIERVMERDCSFFAQHPDAQRYERLYIFGEFWPLLPDDKGQRVNVVQMQPGIRRRYAPALRLLVEDRDKPESTEEAGQ